MASKYKTGYLQRLSTQMPHLNDQNEELEAESQAPSPENTANTELRRAIASPKTLSSNAVMTIQRSYGNQAALRMIQRSREEASQTVQRDGYARGDDTETEDDLNRFLHEKSNIPYFQAYCKKEFSEENFLAYHAIRHYKKNPSRRQAQAIYDQYLAKDSPKELNIPAVRLKEIEETFLPEEFEAKKDTIYDELAVVLTGNLIDTLNRFKVSDDYKVWEKANASFFRRGIDSLRGLKSKREGHMDKYTKYKGQINI